MVEIESQHPFALTRAERLRGRSRVSQLFSDGRSGFVYPLRYVWSEGANEGVSEGASENCGNDEASEDVNEGNYLAQAPTQAQVLFNVPKRFHRRANKRNLLRRRVKEAYRLQKSLLITEGRRPLHLALIYSTKDALSYQQISRAVARILNQLNDERL